MLDYYLHLAPSGLSDLPSALEETGGEGTEATEAHWEELLQSVSNFIFRLIISKHCGRTPRGVKGVKRSEIYWGIQKYSLPKIEKKNHQSIIGEFFTTKKYFLIWKLNFFNFLKINFDAFFNDFWFYSILAGWSTWQWVFLNSSQNFWSFDTPDTPGCASAVIWNRFEPFLL